MYFFVQMLNASFKFYTDLMPAEGDQTHEWLNKDTEGSAGAAALDTVSFLRRVAQGSLMLGSQAAVGLGGTQVLKAAKASC